MNQSHESTVRFFQWLIWGADSFPNSKRFDVQFVCAVAILSIFILVGSVVDQCPFLYKFKTVKFINLVISSFICVFYVKLELFIIYSKLIKYRAVA